MGKGVLTGGIVGGIILYAWGAIAHMALPLGEVGFRSIEHEEVVLPALRQGAPEAGLYFFPGADLHAEQTPEEEAAWTERYKAGPAGLVVMAPVGKDPFTPGMLAAQLGFDLLNGLIAAWLLAHCATAAYGARVLFVGALGLLVASAVNFPYWNWYGFPTDFTLAALAESTVGFLLAGLALARLVKPAS